MLVPDRAGEVLEIYRRCRCLLHFLFYGNISILATRQRCQQKFDAEYKRAIMPLNAKCAFDRRTIRAIICDLAQDIMP